MATEAKPKSASTAQTTKKPKARTASAGTRSTNGSNGSNGGNGHAKTAARSRRSNQSSRNTRGRMPPMPEIPTWIGVVASVVGAGLVAGYYASQKGWFGRVAEWSDGYSAAYADGETDEDNFDQTRSAGRNSMRDGHDDWDDIDDVSDASFPASDPPSFNPGTA